MSEQIPSHHAIHKSFIWLLNAAQILLNRMTGYSFFRLSSLTLLAGMILLCGLTLLSHGQAAANPQCDVTVAEGSSIQSALDDANSGNVICVAPGTFSDDLVIDTPYLTLTVSDAGNPPVIEGSSVAILVSSADSVRIQGLEIREATRGIRLEDSDGVEIIDNTITGNEWGIHDATGSVQALVSGNTITDNSVRAIHFGDSEQATITGNTIRNNAFSAAGLGIGLNISGESTITDNHFEDNSDQAIRATGDSLLIEDNTFIGHVTAIDLLRTSGNRADDARVAGNTFTGNDIGLNVQSSRVEVDGNTFSDNVVDLQLTVARNAVITDNEMEAGLSLDLSPAGSTSEEYFDHQINGNTVDGRPFYFARDTESPSIPDNAAQVWLYNVENATISDLTLEGLAAGIMVGYSEGIEVSGNVLDSLGALAIGAWETEDLAIYNNTVTNNAHVNELPGIKVVDSPDALIDNNTVTGNAQNGIYLARSSNTVIENSIASDNGHNGIFSTSQSHNVTTRNNTAENNSRVGIRYFGGGENGLITGNTVAGNEDGGIEDSMNNNNHGTTISDNTVTDNNDTGIRFRSRDAEITGNTVSGNSGAINSGSDSFVANNTVNDNTGFGIRAGHRSTVRENVVTGSTGTGIEFRISSDILAVGNEVFDNDRVGISVSRSDNAVVDSNTVTGHTVDLQIMDLSENAMVRHNSFETGVVLRSSNAVFDELNHTFVDNTVRDDKPLFFARDEDNPEIPEDAGQIIIVSSTNVDISGFDFSEVAAGVQIVYSNNVSIADNTFDFNHDDDVFMERWAPISVWGTESLRVEDNTLSNNPGFAVMVFKSPEASVTGNQISRQYVGTQFYESPRATFRNNTITGSSLRGLKIEQSDSMRVTGNNIIANEWEGVFVENSFRVKLDSNIVSENERSGMFFDSSDSLVIHGNAVTDNGENGLESHFGFRTSDYVTITGNTITGNEENGIHFNVVDGAYVTGNTVRHNNNGIVLGSPNLISENRITGNSQHGLQISDDTHDPVVHLNSISGNGGIGLQYSGDEPLMAIENWWGDESGPSSGVEDPETGATADGSGDLVGTDVRFDPWLSEDPLGDVETSSDEEEHLPAAFALDQNYPNPFNPVTLIRYHLPEDADVRLDIYTVLGKRVATLVESRRQAGSHEISFDATHLSSGVYIYRLEAGEFTRTRKMMLVK